MSAVLEIESLSAGYGDIPVLRDVRLSIAPGECIGVVGANGAGKTTLLRAISGQVAPRAGRIAFNGRDLRGVSTAARARRGLMHLPEGRGVFRTMSVEDNLRLFGAARADYETIAAHFPVLTARLKQPVALLSGGEQQMLALATSLLARPSLLLIDELSFGLAPAITAQLGAFVRARIADGCTVLLVEESLPLVLSITDRIYVMQVGRIVHEGETSATAKDIDKLTKAYLATD